MNILRFIIAVSTACYVAESWELDANIATSSLIVLTFSGLEKSLNATVDISSGGSAGCQEPSGWKFERSERLVFVFTGDDQHLKNIDNLKSYTYYKFEVKGKTATGTTLAAKDAQPKAPQKLRVTNSLPDKITVSWDQYDCQDLTADFFRFDLFVNDEEVSKNKTETFSDTSLTASGLHPLTVYTAAVQITLANQEKARQTLQVCTDSKHDTGVKTLKVLHADYKRATLSWKKPERTHELKIICNGTENDVETNQTRVTVFGLKHSSMYQCHAQFWSTQSTVIACGNPQKFSIKTKIDVDLKIVTKPNNSFDVKGDFTKLLYKQGHCPLNTSIVPPREGWADTGLNRSGLFNFTRKEDTNPKFICFFGSKSNGSSLVFKYVDQSLTLELKDSEGSSGSLPSGAIIGIIVTVLVLVVVVVAVVIYRRKHSQKQYSKAATSDVELAEPPNGKDTKGASNGAGEGLYDSVDAPRPHPAPRPEPAPRLHQPAQMFGYEAVGDLELIKESNLPEADQQVIPEYSTPIKILKLINEPTDEEEPEDK